MNPQPPRSRRARRSVTSLPFAAAGALFAAVALALYGRHLGEGYLADDFLYAGWARQGPAAILAHTTFASSPQMIRPLPGLAWLASGLPLGAGALHGLSLALHLACAILVVAIVRRRRQVPADCLEVAPGEVPADCLGQVPADCSAVMAGALFLVFPLFAEPVIWLSASFDLWASAFALAALYAAAMGAAGRWSPRRAAAAAAGLFTLALLSKESVIGLPLLLPLLFPWRRVRPAAVATGMVAVLYLGLRLALFGGPGGYVDGGGRSLALAVSPSQIAHVLALQLPARVAIPLKQPGALAPAAALFSFLLLSGLALATGIAGPRPRWPARAARGLGLALVVLAPVLPFLSVTADQEGSRLLYFPVAVLAVTGGVAIRRVSPRAVLVAAALALYWATAVLWNGRSWRAASREVEGTLAALRQLEGRYPAGAFVFVSGHEVNDGAFALRNGVTRAAELAGLRRDLHWFGGTVASTGAAVERLGIDVFAAGLDAYGRPRDWTACERSLLPSAPAALAAGELPRPPSSGPVGQAQIVSPFAPFAAPVDIVAVRLRVVCRPPAPVPLRLSWLAADSRRFRETDALGFLVGPTAPSEIVLRLPACGRPFTGLVLALAGPPEVVDCLRRYRVVAAPAVCRP